MATISPLCQRMLEDLTIRNPSQTTQQSYIYAVAKFSRHFIVHRIGWAWRMSAPTTSNSSTRSTHGRTSIRWYGHYGSSAASRSVRARRSSGSLTGRARSAARGRLRRAAISGLLETRASALSRRALDLPCIATKGDRVRVRPRTASASARPHMVASFDRNWCPTFRRNLWPPCVEYASQADRYAKGLLAVAASRPGVSSPYVALLVGDRFAQDDDAAITSLDMNAVAVCR